jgi:hypothetical protein
MHWDVAADFGGEQRMQRDERADFGGEKRLQKGERADFGVRNRVAIAFMRTLSTPLRIASVRDRGHGLGRAGRAQERWLRVRHGRRLPGRIRHRRDRRRQARSAGRRPGTQLYQGDDTLTGSDDAFSVIDLTASNVFVSGSFRVGIEFQHDGVPSIARDDDGTIRTTRNFIMAPGPGLG